MKRIFTILMALLVVLTVVGCKESKKEDSNKQGYASEKELIDAYRECINKNDITDEFWNAFDYTGYCAYWITEESREITLDEAYNVLVDLDKGTEYIRNNHIAFCEKWKSDKNSEFKVEDLEEKYTSSSIKREEYSKVFANYNKYTPLKDAESYEDDVWRSEFGYNSYSVLVVYNKVDGSVSLKLRYIVRNGRYYWIIANETLGGYGG